MNEIIKKKSFEKIAMFKILESCLLSLSNFEQVSSFPNFKRFLKNHFLEAVASLSFLGTVSCLAYHPSSFSIFPYIP